MGQSVNDGDGREWERWHGVHTGVQGTTLTLGEQETRFDRKQQQHEAALGKPISQRARDWKGETGQASWRRKHLG